MAKINVIGRMRSKNEHAEETFMRAYDSAGILYEERTVAYEADYAAGSFTRISHDNGKTWSNWWENYKDKEEEDGKRHCAVENSPEGDELIGPKGPELFGRQTGGFGPAYGGYGPAYDPQSGCALAAFSSQYLLKGHKIGYFEWWETGADNWRMHGHLAIRRPDGTVTVKQLMWEDGAEFDPENPRNPAFIDKNRGGASDVRRLSDGRLVFYAQPSVRICCKLAGVDVESFFPSCPDTQIGFMLGFLNWNEETQDYDITYSKPVMLGDLQSSRGIMEPRLAELSSGKLLLVVRGSNDVLPQWNTRIGKSVPGFKWYSLSFDGGKTFSPLMPWHFDTREVLYSSASISNFFRSSKNGKLYWVGTYVEKPWLVEGNNPRWPLHICQVNEEDGSLIKDTLTVVDTVRDGQSSVELSNFNLLENPETKALELRLTKINFNEHVQERGGYGDWYSEAWEYDITFDE